MPTRSESSNKIIADLNNQIHALRAQNRQLNQQLLTMKSSKQKTEELLLAATIRSQKHLRVVAKLKAARNLVHTGEGLVILLSILLLVHIGILYLKETKIAADAWKYYFGENFYSLNDARTGSVTTGPIDLVMSIVGQLVFPAP